MKLRIFFPLFLFFFLFFISGVVAAELKYFESSYDIVGGLALSTAGPSYQYFIPYDDYVSGFDIWVENEGSSGTASFGLRDNNDNLLSAKTINVPYMAKTPGGQKLHISFDQPVAVISGQIYKIKMISSMPKLKIYYSNLIDVQVHNATNDFERQIKPAYIGANEQNFFFKFALYEDADIALPIVSNFNVNVISSEKTSFRFNANEPVDYKIAYWPDNGSVQETDFFNNFYSCDEGIKECVLEINTLSNTNYSYQLTVKDMWGNENNITGNFVSSSGWVYSSSTSTPESTSTPQNQEDNSALIISNAVIVSLNDKLVKIAWQTNKAANSSLLISFDTPGEPTLISVGDSVLELEHVLSSGNILRSNMKYIAKIASIDVNGIYVYQEIKFTTLNGASQPGEQNQQPENNNNNDSEENSLNGDVQQDNQGNYSFNIAWSDNQYSGAIGGYRLDIFDSNKNLSKQVLISQEKRSVIIEGLSSGEYYAIVYSNNKGVFEKVAAPENFKIPPVEEKTFKKLDGFKKYFSGKILYIILFLLLMVIGSIIFYAIKKKNAGQ